MSLTAGVLAVQGDVAEHRQAFTLAAERRDIDLTVEAVREPNAIAACDVLALPGGESTAISRLLDQSGTRAAIGDHVGAGRPLLATCAGLIVAAADANDERVEPLGLVDATVTRNAFGRQRDSFETALSIDGLAEPFPGVFIRAPVIASVGSASVIATHDGEPVAVADGPVIGTAFHPELTDDTRLHERVLGRLQ